MKDKKIISFPKGNVNGKPAKRKSDQEKLQKHAGSMKETLLELEKEGIGGIYMLHYKGHSTGNSTNVPLVVLADFIRHMFKDERLFQMVMHLRISQLQREKIDD